MLNCPTGREKHVLNCRPSWQNTLLGGKIYENATIGWTMLNPCKLSQSCFPLVGVNNLNPVHENTLNYRRLLGPINVLTHYCCYGFMLGPVMIYSQNCTSQNQFGLSCANMLLKCTRIQEMEFTLHLSKLKVERIKGGFLVRETEHKAPLLHNDLIEANNLFKKEGPGTPRNLFPSHINVALQSTVECNQFSGCWS